MNGQNNSLRTDTVRFLTSTPVNVSEIVERSVTAVAAEPMISKVKYGMFDLTADGSQAWLKEVSRTGVTGADAALIAYWCPFRQGHGAAAGWVDVPKTRPVTEYVFTAAMNGCALLITQSPLKQGDFRVIHHQHPTKAKERAAVNIASGISESDIVFEFNDTEYDSPPTTGSFYQCFNFLRYEAPKWRLYSQYTKLAITMSGKQRVSTATLDPSRPVLVKDVTIP